MAYIYGLIDPITFEIRYVGKTKYTLEQRLKTHIQFIKWEKSYKSDWIKSLLNKNMKPIPILLEECEDWQNAEKFWIKLCKSIGYKLTNLTEGGDGVVNGSVEIGKRISEKNKGRIGPNKGKKFSEEWRKNLSSSRLKTHGTKETKDKISKINKGRIRSDEFKEKVSSSMKNANLVPWNKGIKLSNAKPNLYEKLLKLAESRKGKSNLAIKGKPAPNRKLTDEDVKNIREEWLIADNQKGLTKILAKRYGVHKDTITNIITNKTYKTYPL